MSRRVIRSQPRDKWQAAKEVRQEHDPEWQKRLEKAMYYAKGSPLHMDREERLELARMVPGVSTELDTWKDLTRSQLDDLINMLEGWIFISFMLEQRDVEWASPDTEGDNDGQ